jgi:uncharacterized protein with ATP-grasp and redox domains
MNHPIISPGTSQKIRKCGVEVSVDQNGTPHSAVARTVLSDDEQKTTRETKIAFHISDGVAFFEGFVEPDQVSVPHFKTVPAACEQVSNVSGITDAESPIETISHLFSEGRELPHIG